jgi:hypothetical protein
MRPLGKPAIYQGVFLLDSLLRSPFLSYPSIPPAVQAILYQTLEALTLPSNSTTAPWGVFGWPAMLALPAALSEWHTLGRMNARPVESTLLLWTAIGSGSGSMLTP